MSEAGGPDRRGDQTPVVLVGVALIVLGVWFIGRNLGLPYVEPLLAVWAAVRSFWWALSLIALGTLIIFMSQRPGVIGPASGARLRRSRSKKMVGGVLGGLADYLRVDVTAVRLLFVFLWLIPNPPSAVIAYIIASAIIPYEPEASHTVADAGTTSEDGVRDP